MFCAGGRGASVRGAYVLHPHRLTENYKLRQNSKCVWKGLIVNKYIIFGSVLMPVAKIIKINPCLSKMQLAEIGAFFVRHMVRYITLGFSLTLQRSFHLVGRVPRRWPEELLQIGGCEILQAECPCCLPTNSVRALPLNGPDSVGCSRSHVHNGARHVAHG